MSDEPLMTTTEVAAMLKLHYRKVQRLARDGTLQAAQQLPGPNGARLFDRATVLRYQADAAKEAEPTAAAS